MAIDSIFTTLYSLISPITDSINNFAMTGSDPFGEFYSRVIIGIIVLVFVRMMVLLAVSKMNIDVAKNKTAFNVFSLMIGIAASFGMPVDILRTMFSIGSFAIVIFVFVAVAYGVYLLNKKITESTGQNKLVTFSSYAALELVVALGWGPIAKALPLMTNEINGMFGVLISLFSLLCLFSFVSLVTDLFRGSNQARSIERRNSPVKWIGGKWRSLRDRMPQGFVRNVFAKIKGARYNYDPKPIVAEVIRETSDMGKFFLGCGTLIQTGAPVDKIHVDTFEASFKSLEKNLGKIRAQANLLEDGEIKGGLLAKIDAYTKFFVDFRVKEGIRILRNSTKTKNEAEKLYILDMNSFIWHSSTPGVVVALKDFYAYFYNLYNKYDQVFPKESTFENELAVALNVKSIEEETRNLIGIIQKSAKTYVLAKGLRKEALDLYRGLESTHPNEFVSFSAKCSLHSNFLNDFFTWIGVNGTDYVINENTFGIHEENVMKHGLQKYKDALKKNIAILKKSQNASMLEMEIKNMEVVRGYVEKLYFVLNDVLKMELRLIKGDELQKAWYLESIQKIILQIAGEVNVIDDKDFTANLAPKMQELQRIYQELKNIRDSRLSVSYEFEYREEQRMLNELLTFLR